MRNLASVQEIILLNKLKTFELYGCHEMQVPIAMMTHFKHYRLWLCSLFIPRN